MNLTKLTLNNSRITIIAILLVAAFGVSNYFKMERDSMPPYTVRFATVVTGFPGASPIEVESLVTDPLEEVLREIPQVKTISSESRPGLSVITLELITDVSGSELQSVWTVLRNKVADNRMYLPQNIMGPIVKDEDIGTVYGIILGVTGDGVSYKLLEDYAKDAREQLLSLPDVSKIKYGGIQQEIIYIEFEDKKLAHYGVDVNKIRNIIYASNILQPGGEVNIGRQRISLVPSGNFDSLEDIKKIMIPTSGGVFVYLEDLTKGIYRDYLSPREKVVTVNGRPAIALFLSLKDGANIVRMGKEVDESIEQINRSMPLGVELVRSASQDRVVDGQVNDFLVNLVQSIIIVLSVMLVFLGLRTGSLVASLLPMVILTSFFFLGLLDLGFNKVSLAALIISLGLLVDNGIVVSESILVSMKKGMTILEASIYSGRVLSIPLLISSLTTSAAFLPFALANTPMGEISSQLFWVVSTTLLASWVLAFTLIPMLAILIVKSSNKSKGKWGVIVDEAIVKANLWYNKLLVRVLKRPARFLSLIIALFALALFSIQFIPFKLVPDSNRNLVTVDIEFPSGTQIEYTEKAVKDIENFIDQHLLVDSKLSASDKGVLDYSAFIGEGPEPYDLGYFKNEAKSSYAHMLLNTSGDKNNDYIIAKVDSFCMNSIPDALIRVNRLTGAGASGTPVEIRISGSDPDKLQFISEQVKGRLRGVNGTKNVSDNWGPKIKKLYIDIDPHKARRAGLTNMETAMALNSGMSGMRVGEFREENKRIPIFLKSDYGVDNNIEELTAFNIYSAQAGRYVPLAEIATISTEWQFSKIIRKDLERSLTVGAYLIEGYTAADIFKEMDSYMEEQKATWDIGYEYEFGGEDEDKAENLGAIFANLPLAFFIIIFLLVLQFNSIRKTIIIGISIPLGIIGVVVGWFIGGSFVSFFGVLGVIALAGIVVNNAIILIDRIDVEFAEDPSANKRDLIIRAAHNRFRPVLLTTLTTSLGMLPLWFSGDLLWEPLALAIIFGLLFATVITLLYVPVLYRLFYKINFSDYKFDSALFNLPKTE
ncbi:MAG: efflux RND transporter permease subunit [Bacteroidales bacterium]|nr:efflux RND transporter permease subunit [Bacteroidales bacterium]